MSNELKPCPFCGSTDLFVKRAVITEYHDETPFIRCDSCGFVLKDKELCTGINCGPKENEKFMDRQVASKWNTRPAEDEMYRELDKCQSYIQHFLDGRWDDAVAGETENLLIEIKAVLKKVRGEE